MTEAAAGARESSRYWTEDLPFGEHRVEERALVLVDHARNKELRVLARLPQGGGPAPVVLVSHGAAGQASRMAMLMDFWASHGFACLAPTHDDLSRIGTPDSPRDVYSPEGAANRAQDLTFIIDSLPRERALSSRVDPGRVAVVGHSYGAYITMLLAGATPVIDGRRQSLVDDRPRAFLILSGAGPGLLGLTEDSWADCHRPMMVVTGSRDVRGEGMGPDWRKQSFVRSPPLHKYFVLVDGATHDSFVGKANCESAELADRERRIFSCVRAAGLLMWRMHLERSGDGGPQIVAGTFEVAGVRISVETR